VPIVKCHHERIDGKGYPEGICGDEIPFFAKIISVADAFDAMMSDRQYRSKLELGTAVEQLKDGRGTQFDTDLVDIFVGLLANFEVIQEELEALNDTIFV
jgi:HD-GYP domain-containing protein (c-di-GMP phosphodiesterase class II)